MGKRSGSGIINGGGAGAAGVAVGVAGAGNANLEQRNEANKQRNEATASNQSGMNAWANEEQRALAEKLMRQGNFVVSTNNDFVWDSEDYPMVVVPDGERDTNLYDHQMAEWQRKQGLFSRYDPVWGYTCDEEDFVVVRMRNTTDFGRSVTSYKLSGGRVLEKGRRSNNDPYIKIELDTGETLTYTEREQYPFDPMVRVLGKREWKM